MSWFARLFRRRPRPTPAPVPVPPPVVNTTMPILGIVAHRCDIDREIPAMSALGIRYARTTYYTAEAASNPTYDAAFDVWRLAQLRAAGMEPLVVVHDFPATGDASVAVTMARLAATFPGTTWQIGNEYDAQDWSPWRTGDAYARLMLLVVPAMLSADPSCRIVSLGLATAGNDAARHTAFIRAYRAANGPRLAAWCIHTYGVPLVDAFRSLCANAYVELFGSRMPLWVTEFGIEAINLTSAYGNLPAPQIDALQASSWQAVLDAAPSCGVARLYGYALESGDDDGHGIMRRDWSERPACTVVRAYTNRSRA